LAALPLGKNRPNVGMNVFILTYSSHVNYDIQHEHQFVVFKILNKSVISLDHLGGGKLSDVVT